MTRKRFVKLLMSMGIDRNSSVLIAADARKSYGDYKTAFVSLYPMKQIEDMCISVAKAAIECIPSILSATLAIKEFVDECMA